MTDEDDHIARYQRPPRKGQFKPGQSGNALGRPKGSKNIRTYVNEHLNKKIPIIEGGKTRKVYAGRGDRNPARQPGRQRGAQRPCRGHELHARIRRGGR
jgi:hypothetical protein